jgi:hypothetical protein
MREALIQMAISIMDCGVIVVNLILIVIGDLLV